MLATIPFPNVRHDRVVIHCLNCGHATEAASFVIKARFGYLPYGVITGLLHCRSGCGDRYAVVLPLDAPTPRAWAEKYGAPPPPPKDERPPATAVENSLPGALVEIGPGGTFQKIHARADDPEILHWGFDYLLEKARKSGREAPHLAVTRGAQWSRDSRRDFKVVPNIPYEPDRRPDRPAGHSTPPGPHPRVGGNHRAHSGVGEGPQPTGEAMTDDKSKAGAQDRARINQNEDYEVRDWSAKFGVSRERLLAAIDKAGPMAADVARELGKTL